ncbi:hypothetical protein SAMN04487788_1688 [Microbacterium testaceum StLB037]|uniref:Uncharacterized protein n=1 Tax=Microbacterium testaceum (strain StLB037) TaxID=979556 RepID=A0A1H0P1R9_MICTS|nr:hypothetical protein SAMN04487788_1688 [Microbacterium testaceum StLB037]
MGNDHLHKIGSLCQVVGDGGVIDAEMIAKTRQRIQFCADST